MKKLPIGIQDFVKIREQNYLYVDKTGKLLELIEQGERYFLSRLRRFGKSLMLSTLDAMFRGRKEYFKGLAAEEWVTRQSENPSPVLRFDISSLKLTDSVTIEQALSEMIERTARRNKVELHSQSMTGKLIDLIEEISYQGQVVVLVDEYDKPILDNLSDIRKAHEMREVLRSFYTVLKSCDEYLRFVLITGISKFSKVGVFSAMNNLEDISMDKSCDDIAGYTQGELEYYFVDWLEAASAEMGITHDELIERLRDYYDGFSFDGRTRLYNPFSILQCLKKGEFRNYWYESGSPSFIKEKKTSKPKAPSLESLKLWEVEGISRRTFYYRRKAEKEAQARREQKRSLFMAMIIKRIVNRLYTSEVYDCTAHAYIMRGIEGAYMCENKGGILFSGGLIFRLDRMRESLFGAVGNQITAIVGKRLMEYTALKGYKAVSRGECLKQETPPPFLSGISNRLERIRANEKAKVIMSFLVVLVQLLP